MNKSLIIIIVLIVVLLSALFYFIYPQAKNRVDNLDTGRSYGTIQEAINAKETLPGHTLLVYPGVYRENILVNKTLAIEGQNRDTTIIEKGIMNTTIIILVQASGSTIANLTVREAHFGIWCVQTAGCRILNNRVIDCLSAGIRVDFSNNTLVKNNELTNETLLGTRLLRGIHIYGSSHNIVENNTITNIRNFTDIGGTMRSYAAIDVEGSLERPLKTSINNTLVQNRLENNSCGIWINTLVANTKLYHNAFVNNIRQVNDVLGTSTAWDNGYSSGGNYWSDYEGTDTNGDNIGDTPYTIDLGNADRYPLMRPPE